MNLNTAKRVAAVANPHLNDFLKEPNPEVLLGDRTYLQAILAVQLESLKLLRQIAESAKQTEINSR